MKIIVSLGGVSNDVVIYWLIQRHAADPDVIGMIYNVWDLFYFNFLFIEYFSPLFHS
jgi:hypothetical protein